MVSYFHLEKKRMLISTLFLLPTAMAFSASHFGHSTSSSLPIGMVCNYEDCGEESNTRRQLLFSLLAASGSTFLSPNAAVGADVAPETLPVNSPLIEDWSNINILKPPKDDRDYVAFVLENGLKVVLCSDPLSNEAGAAMDVHVGACSDPKDVRGLAHFNEHMLFL
jgi:hypothetical protein